MKVDWKHLATTPGYLSLKDALIQNAMGVRRHNRPTDLAADRKKFYWVIGRAQHYAYHKGKSIEFFLNEWEEKRDYTWHNFYQDSNQPLLHTYSRKESGINGIRKYYKKWSKHSNTSVKSRMCDVIADRNKKSSVKVKPRWSMAKKRANKVRKLIA